jgi:hypothetical protein
MSIQDKILDKLADRILEDKSGNSTSSIYSSYIDTMVIIRTYSAGVFYGKLKQIENDALILDHAKRIWCWYGANSLSDIAIQGVTDKSQTKICAPINNHLIKGFIEIIPLSENALSNLDSIKIWSQIND